MSASVFRAFAASSPGLEPMLAAELERLGVRGEPEPGGVEFAGPRELLWKVHRECRLAESIRVRLKAFDARTFAELESGLGRLPWHAYLRAEALDSGRLRIDVTCHRSRLYHSDAVGERVARVIAARLGGGSTTGHPHDAPTEAEPSPTAQRVFVRILRDRVQVSIDASGERLHRRGYRVDVGRAPLRETLAAALGMLLEHKSGGVSLPVWDPFCGSGTLLLEWLALTSGIAAGGRRHFAFEHWPVHDAGAYVRWQAEQGDRRLPPSAVKAYGSDVSERAIAAAVANSGRAGLTGACRWWAQDFRQAAEQIPVGTRILTNPPYGVRMARGKTRELFSALDELLTGRPDLRPVVLLCGDAEYVGRSQLAWRVELAFKSGGLSVSALSLGS